MEYETFKYWSVPSIESCWLRWEVFLVSDYHWKNWYHYFGVPLIKIPISIWATYLCALSSQLSNTSEDFSDATFVEQTDDFAQLHGIRGNLIWLGGDLPNHDYDGRKQYITFLFLQSRKINTNIFFWNTSWFSAIREIMQHFSKREWRLRKLTRNMDVIAFSRNERTHPNLVCRLEKLRFFSAIWPPL